MAKQQNLRLNTRIREFADDILRKNVHFYLLESFAFIVTTALMFKWPMTMLSSLIFLFGIPRVLYGIYRVYMGYINQELHIAHRAYKMADGVVSIALGVIFLFQHSKSLIYISYFITALLLIKAISILLPAIQTTILRFGKYKLNLGISIGLVILSLLTMAIPLSDKIFFVRCTAAILCVFGIADLYLYFRLLRLKNKYPNIQEFI